MVGCGGRKRPFVYLAGAICAAVLVSIFYAGATGAGARSTHATPQGNPDGPPPVGDRLAVWVVEQAEDQFTIEYLPRTNGDLRVGGERRVWGQVHPKGVAAADGVLWIVYEEDLSIQAVHPEPHPFDGSVQFTYHAGPRLPEGMTLLELAADGGTVWALVRLEDDEALSQLAALEPLTKEDIEDTPPPDIPDTPEPPEPPDAQDPGVPETPAPPDTPETPDPPDTPEPPEHPDDDPDATDAPDTPDGPQAPEASVPAERPVAAGAAAPAQAASSPDGQANAEQADEQQPPREQEQQEQDAEAEAEPADDADEQPPDDPEAELDETDLPREALLRLAGGGGQWQRLPLPEDWSHGRETIRLVAIDPIRTGRLALLSCIEADQPDDGSEADGNESGDQPNSLVRVDRIHLVAAETPQWKTSRKFRLNHLPDADKLDEPRLVAAGITGQLVAGLGRVEAERLTVALGALRDDAPRDDQDHRKAIGIGTVEMDVDNGAGPWSLIGMGQAAALVHVGPDREVTWSRVFLSGRVTEPVRVEREAQRDKGPSPQVMVFSVVLALATMLVVVFLRRDGTQQELTLPQTIAVVDLPPRFFAGLVDLGVLVLLAALVTPHSITDILRSHPAIATSFAAMTPFATVVAVYVLYCIATEWAGVGTMGKRLMRLRVVDLQGGQPHFAAITVRNLVKVIDLITIVLLLLPVLTRYRQRLGDLVARTVVVLLLDGSEQAGPDPRKRSDERKGDDAESSDDESLRDAESHRDGTDDADNDRSSDR